MKTDAPLSPWKKKALCYSHILVPVGGLGGFEMRYQKLGEYRSELALLTLQKSLFSCFLRFIALRCRTSKYLHSI